MVADKIENANLYANLSERLTKALEILKNTDFAEKEDGRYDVDGDNLYYFVQRYTTKPADQCKLEAHKNYIDIQFVADGRELLGYCPLENLEIREPYNQAKDVALYQLPDNVSVVNLVPGMFCVLFPQDVHMPKCQLDAPSNVLKVVVKVKINA